MTRRAPALIDLAAGTGWSPIRHLQRVPITICLGCKARCLTEHNALHRAGWEEARLGWAYLYRCGRCAERNRP